MSPDQVIPVRQRGGRQQVRLGPSPWQRRGRTDVRRGRGGDREEGITAPETLRKVSSSLQDEMRERISTFETVLNVDQFLVRLLVSGGVLCSGTSRCL